MITIPRFEIGEQDKSDLEKYTTWIEKHANDINPQTTTRTGRLKNKRLKELILSRTKAILKILERAKIKF